MKAFWDDSGQGVASNAAVTVDLPQAASIWSDEVRGVKGNFFGLIDDQERTIQFYHESSIPNHIDDASHLRIVLMDFPQRQQKGSYNRRVTIGEVHRLIEPAFELGADPRHFGELTFTPW